MRAPVTAGAVGNRPAGLGWTAWLGIFLLAAVLRLWQLGDQILIDDEWHAIHRLMSAGYAEIFLSLGHADYSIPLTLMFRLLAETIGLHEWQMRILPLLSGTATVVLVPQLLRQWLNGRERLLLAALLAISPQLIHFSRYARPYAMMVLLGLVAVLMLWQWWEQGGRWRAVLFACCTVLAAWMHPLSALFSGAALLWFGVAGLWRWRRQGRACDLGHLLLLGCLTVAASCALLLPPMLADPWSIAAKTGEGQISALTLLRSWELTVGTSQKFMALLLLALALVGAAVLARRDLVFTLFWAWLAGFSLLVIALLEPAWIQNAAVLVRYMAIAIPMALMLVAIGLHTVLRLLARIRLPAPLLTGTALLFFCALLVAGPLWSIYGPRNQFANAARYLLDYDFERSLFSGIYGPVELPEADRRMMAEPGRWEIIEAGWHFESPHSALSQYQRLHRLSMRIGMLSGLCNDWDWGELRTNTDQRIVLNRFLFLSELLDRPVKTNRFVVFRHVLPFEWSRELPAPDDCIQAFVEAYGPPWMDTPEATVFRLPAGIVPGGF